MATFVVTLMDGTVIGVTADLYTTIANSEGEFLDFISAATATPQSVARYPSAQVTQVLQTS